jgi:TOTE conflict system primase-like protein/CHC2-type zinc finger protein
MGYPEHPPQRELDAALVERFAASFIPRRDCYPWQQPNGKYVTVHKPLTSHLLVGHLKGALTLGAYALDSASMAHWICLDADDDEAWNGLLSLAATLEDQAVPLYRETSRRGGHLWLFTPPLPGVFARRFAVQLLAEHNLNNIEIYPRQGELTSGPGSLVRLPLGVHRKTGKVYPFVNRAGLPLAPTPREQLEFFITPARLPLPFLMGVLSHIPPDPKPQPKPTPEFKTTVTTDQTPLSERLKATISVLEFVSRYVPLDERNLGWCPFHDDRIKSFGVHAEQNYWHCFAGCGGGSIIDFWMQWRETHGQDSSFTATITELRQMLLAR